MPSGSAPMTLGNMRANAVRTLAAWCLGRGCNHFRVAGFCILSRIRWQRSAV